MNGLKQWKGGKIARLSKRAAWRDWGKGLANGGIPGNGSPNGHRRKEAIGDGKMAKKTTKFALGFFAPMTRGHPCRIVALPRPIRRRKGKRLALGCPYPILAAPPGGMAEMGTVQRRGMAMSAQSNDASIALGKWPIRTQNWVGLGNLWWEEQDLLQKAQNKKKIKSFFVFLRRRTFRCEWQHSALCYSQRSNSKKFELLDDSSFGGQLKFLGKVRRMSFGLKECEDHDDAIVLSNANYITGCGE